MKEIIIKALDFQEFSETVLTPPGGYRLANGEEVRKGISDGKISEENALITGIDDISEPYLERIVYNWESRKNDLLNFYEGVSGFWDQILIKKTKKSEI